MESFLDARVIVPQLIWVVTTVAVLAWRFAKYPDRAEVDGVVNKALTSEANPYVKDAAAIRRVIERYDRDQDALRAKLDEIAKGLRDLTIELRVLAELRARQENERKTS